MVKMDPFKQNQLMFANSLFAAAIVISFIIWRELSNRIETAMFLSAILTSFYFWWGYIFFALKLTPNQQFKDYLLDFVGAIFLFSLFYITISKLDSKEILFVVDMILLLSVAILKYLLMNSEESDSGKKRFYKKKIKIDAASLVSMFFLLSISLTGFEFFAMLILPVALILHIFYFSFFDKIYQI